MAIGTAAAIIGGSLISGALSSSANSKAAKAQANAAAQAADVQERMYNQSREDLSPYREAGVGANNQLSYLLGLNPNITKGADGAADTSNYDNINKNMGDAGSLTKKFTLDDFTADPGYQFALDQGNKGIAAKQAASGNLYSGKALKAATTYGQNMGTQQYDTVRNRYIQDQDSIYNKLAGVSNSGQQATNTGVANNTNNANAMGNIYGQLGQQQANNAIAQGNIYSNMASSISGGGQSSYAPWGTRLSNTGLSYGY